MAIKNQNIIGGCCVAFCFRLAVVNRSFLERVQVPTECVNIHRCLLGGAERYRNKRRYVVNFTVYCLFFTQDSYIKQTTLIIFSKLTLIKTTTMAGKGKKFLSIPSTPPPKEHPPTIPTTEQIQARRKSIPPNRALVDADKAELVALDLLSLCADTTRHFAALARGDETVRMNQGQRGGNMDGMSVVGVGGDSVGIHRLTRKEKKKRRTSRSDSMSSTTSSIGSRSSSSSEEEKDRMTLIRKNGIKFQHALKKIHDLLAPHANLVVNYTTNQESTMRKSENKEQKEEEKQKQKEEILVDIKKEESDTDANIVDEEKVPTIDGQVDANDKDKQEKESDQVKSVKDESKEHQNMYYSRLEKKLAMDRRNLLKDMLSLEKKLQCVDEQTPKTGEISNQDCFMSNKRKRQD